MFFPSEKEFLRLSKKGNLVPVYKEILGDLETPVSAFLRIARSSPYAFLLESVEGGEKVSRYSFLARDPELVLQSQGRTLTVTRFASSGRKDAHTITLAHSPLLEAQKIMATYRFVSVKGLPRFCGGLIGYIGYDVVRFHEHLPNKPKDDLGLADMMLSLTRDLIIFDHLDHKIKVVSCVHLKDKATVAEKRAAYRRAQNAIHVVIKELQRPFIPVQGPTRVPKTPTIRSNVTPAQFKQAVRTAKNKIRAGDIIQVVLSQRFTTKVHTHPFNIYRSLRTVNPSPYMYYLRFDDLAIVGSSPELLVRCEDGIVETRPIAGTRRRGKDEKEDLALARDLLADPKERAEHLMLVDLGRNDLGRVCERGTVKVSEFMSIEHYSHVMHIVSNVKGTLRKNKSVFDVIGSAFPAGTVSGAPKIRAMEIIDALEPNSRGPYAGCIGYISFSGNLDTCITIRTIVIKDQDAYIQAGAGIVADSIPQKEWTETMNKAKAQLAAIQLAHETFA